MVKKFIQFYELSIIQISVPIFLTVNWGKHEFVLLSVDVCHCKTLIIVLGTDRGMFRQIIFLLAIS